MATVTVSTVHAYQVDTEIVATITVSPLTGDDILEATDLTSTVLISGTVGGDVRVGDRVTIIIGSNVFYTFVTAGSVYELSVDGSLLALETETTVRVNTEDDAGNTTSTEVVHPYTISP